MRKLIALVPIVLVASVLGIAGCGQDTSEPAAVDAANLVADEPSYPSASNMLENQADVINYVDYNATDASNANGDAPGPRGQSGSQTDRPRPKGNTSEE